MEPLTYTPDISHSHRRSPATRRFDIVVVVPARNEEQLIGASLTSVVDASRRAVQHVDRVAISVVADSCTDRTVEIARSVLAAQPLWSVTECDLGNVALVRSLGVEVGRRLLGSVRSDRIWMASTDADTMVPGDWLIDHVEAATRGTRALAGAVDIECFDGLPASARTFFTETYTDLLPSHGHHSHVHAANLGVRLDAYDDAGGWGSLPRSEDRDLWTRLERTGALVESPSSLRVVTSGRSIGRVPGGFADCLRRQVRSWENRELKNDDRRTA